MESGLSKGRLLLRSFRWCGLDNIVLLLASFDKDIACVMLNERRAEVLRCMSRIALSFEGSF